MDKNLSSVFLTRSDTNRAVQSQMITRGLKYRILEVFGVVLSTCMCEKSKALIVCTVSVRLLRISFAHLFSKCRLFRGSAH